MISFAEKDLTQLGEHILCIKRTVAAIENIFVNNNVSFIWIDGKSADFSFVGHLYFVIASFFQQLKEIQKVIQLMILM